MSPHSEPVSRSQQPRVSHLPAAGRDTTDTTGTDTESPGAAATTDAELAALIPEAVADDGVIVVATDASYPPNEFFAEDNTTLIGMDIDLGTALGDVLGLEVRFEQRTIRQHHPGPGVREVRAGHVVVHDQPERLQVVDMVSYFVAGTAWAVPVDNPGDVSPDSACGKKVAVQKATVQVDDITARSEECLTSGESEITIDQYTLQTDATTAVVSGKDDAMLADSPVVAYAVKQTGGQLELVGDSYDDAPYGIAVPKDDPDFAGAFRVPCRR